MVAILRIKLKKVQKAAVRQRWNLEKIKEYDTAVNYRCEIDTDFIYLFIY